MANPSLAELLAMERDPNVPDAAMETRSSKLRRALFQGEVLTTPQATARFGGSPTTLAATVGQLERLGFHIERGGSGDGSITYRLTNPRHQPNAEQMTAERERSKHKSTKRRRDAGVPARAVAVQEDRPTQVQADGVPPGGDVAGQDGIPPLPALGQPVTVYALALNDDGTITLGLRALNANGSGWPPRRWVTTVTGTAEA